MREAARQGFCVGRQGGGLLQLRAGAGLSGLSGPTPS